MSELQRCCVVCTTPIPDNHPQGTPPADRRLPTRIGGRTYHVLLCGDSCLRAWNARSSQEKLATLFGSWRHGAWVLRSLETRLDRPGDGARYFPVNAAIQPKPPTEEEKEAARRAGLRIRLCRIPDDHQFPWRGCPDCRHIVVSWIRREVRGVAR